MLQSFSHIVSDDDDIESILEEQSEEDSDTQYVLPLSDSESDSFDKHIGYLGSNDFTVFSTTAQSKGMSQIDTTPRPTIQVKILFSKYDRPFNATALVDTGSCATIIKPHLLPKELWAPLNHSFTTVNQDPFHIELISRKKVGIKFFPGCLTWVTVLGSYILDKDLLLGFDTFYRTKHLSIFPQGLKFKNFFAPFTTIPSILEISQVPFEYERIKDDLLQFCTDGHSQFHHPSPLWKNTEFFIRLPFKKNEDVNPTKASHSGMNPDDLLLAKQECKALLDQGLIEPTTSNWACQAFYVEKRSEKIRGKKRLVIDYKPLNLFLQDDKFPLPKMSTLASRIAHARIFSKFDLKAGFWQIGIHPEERYKTAFCIPDAQYQWKVLPFGLKVAPSLFQKAMIKIFEPILNNTLIYIDDILLFSSDHETHKQLLSQFTKIIAQYGIMLSSKKSFIAQEKIEFLGMTFHNGFYQPGPHIAKDLLDFPDNNLSVKQIQQFLGIINYLRDFIPDVTRHTSQLSKLLKKNPSLWTTEQTKAVAHLKQIAQNPPPLKIPGKGQRILQTDASDHYWGAVLLEEIDGRRHYCGHASGQFKEAEKHYHATYKEILAVKRGIEKFNFHLAAHEFTVEMDNTSFPSMLETKKKTLPDSQLLRWKDWFSRYKFEVKHIKGKQNTLADFLSRPSKILLLTPKKPIAICTLTNMTSFPPHIQYISSTDHHQFPPCDQTPTNPFQIQRLAKRHLFYWLHTLIKTHRPNEINSPLTGIFDIEKPFMCVPNFWGSVPEELSYYIWCASALYATAFSVEPLHVYHNLCDSANAGSELWKMFNWFAPLSTWRSTLRDAIMQHKIYDVPEDQQTRFKCFFVVHRPYNTDYEGRLYATGQAHCWNSYTTWPQYAEIALKNLYLFLHNLNNCSHTDQELTCTSIGPIPHRPFVPRNRRVWYRRPREQEFSPQTLQLLDPDYGPRINPDPESSARTPSPDPPLWSSLYQDSQDPDDSANDSDSPDPNMSPSHEPICKG